MYPPQEASRIKQEFWTTFGQYMSPVRSSGGERINWVNYKTGEQHIRFSMDADNHHATIAIIISHNDTGIQELYYEQFRELRNMLHDTLGEQWAWVKFTRDAHGKTVCRIYGTLENVNVFRQEDWPFIISFFKQRIIALDEFWSQAKYAFEALK